MQDTTDTILTLWDGWWTKTKHRSPVTMRNYRIAIRPLLVANPELTLTIVKLWVAEAEGVETRRFRARVARAFCQWASSDDGIAADYEWWKKITLPDVLPPTAQPTVQPAEAKAALLRCGSVRDKAIVAVLWSTGVRVSELCRMRIEDLHLSEGMLRIPSPSKRGMPRLVNLDEAAVKVLVRLLRGDIRTEGPLWNGTKGALTESGVSQLLRRIEAKPAHAWRRGWATEMLRRGVSEVAVMRMGGWKSLAMVARYTTAAGNELAIAEVKRMLA